MPKEVWWGRAEIEAADPVFDLLRRLIDNHRDNGPLMPLVALQPDEEDESGYLDERTTQIVDFVHQAHRHRKLMAKRLEGGGGEDAYESAIAMLRELSEHSWENQKDSQYKPFAFPRSRLLRAIEQAAPEVGDGQQTNSTAASQRRERLMRRLAELRWRPGQDYDAPEGRDPGPLAALGAVVNPSNFVGALFIALLSVVLSEGRWQPAVWGGLVALGVFAVVQAVVRKAPPLLWLRRASRWFAMTTFLAPSSDRFLTSSGDRPQATGWSRWRPSKSWETIQGRAFSVAQQVVAAQAGDQTARQFHLELRVLALLEDLRHNYRPRSLDMRRRKRTVPPVVYLPQATEANGGLLLLRTISNVRSRRSEMDPLLVLAAIPAAEPLRPLVAGGPPDLAPAAHLDDTPQASAPDARYWRWVANLSVGQSPSRAAALPWILWLPLRAGQLRGSHSVQHSTTRIRRTATWLLWSRPCLAVVLLLALILGFLGNQVMANRYCEGQLINSNRDAQFEGHGPQRQCIGVATGDYLFTKNDTTKLTGVGSRITFHQVEQAIRKLNASIRPGEDSVTIVYAGALSGQEPTDFPKSSEELAGVYISQYQHNRDSPVKIKVLLANAGRNFLHASDMAKRIRRVAERDSSIVGVVGLGRDVTDSGNAVDSLRAAGLPVVDTTNSGEYLAQKYSNYFGLAATDQEQANTLELVASQVAKQTINPKAVVLSRRTDPGDKDQYTKEQAKVGGGMLHSAGFTVLNPEEYEIKNGNAPNLNGPVDEICQQSAPTALYFAGRVEDVGPLMTQLSKTPNCSDAHITVFTGDDVSKSLNDKGSSFAENYTLYHTSLAPMDLAKENTEFYEKARTSLQEITPLPKSHSKDWFNDGLFISGQAVMAYSAMEALYTAATYHGHKAGTRAEVWANMRSVEIDSMPTGTITFKNTQPYGDQKVHGIEVIRLTYRQGKRSAPVVCGRPAGDDHEWTNPGCRLQWSASGPRQ